MTKSIATPAPPRTIAFTYNPSRDLDLQTTDQPFSTSSFNTPRGSRTCVITLDIHHHNPCTCKRRNRSRGGHYFWVGALWDSSSMTYRDGLPPICHQYAEDDSRETRDCVIRHLQALAQTKGYTHSVVQEYPIEEGGDYIPLFGGALSALTDTY